MKKFPTLYSRTSTGAIQEWTIIVKGNHFYTRSGQVGGAIVESKPNLCVGKNIGKANETLPEQQALAEAQAKWEKQIKKDYKEDIAQVDALTFLEPMTAKKFAERKDKVKYPVAIEGKLNGGRAVLWKNPKLTTLYSRNGEMWNCVGHIVEAVADARLFNLWPDLVLDGELYNPSLKNNLGKLMSLVSVMRKPDEIAAQEIEEARQIAQFHVYDAYGHNGITKDTPFEERKAALEKLVKGIPYIYYHGYTVAKSEAEVEVALEASRKRKEEGIMVKILGAPYENKRSKYFLKYKNFEDAEFPIKGFTEGSGNWAGCAKTVICKLPKPNKQTGETTFEATMRGTIEELTELLKNKKKYIGQLATVEFQEYSPYGVPLIPYCSLPFRNYE